VTRSFILCTLNKILLQ